MLMLKQLSSYWRSWPQMFLQTSLEIGNLTIFVRCKRLIARKLAVLFGFNCGVRPFYEACYFDELRRGSVLCLLNASFEKRFHNATTQVFTPKLMTMASAGATRGEYLPDGGVQWHLGYPETCRTGQCARHHTAWRLIGMAIEMASKSAAFCFYCWSFVVHNCN